MKSFTRAMVAIAGIMSAAPAMADTLTSPVAAAGKFGYYSPYLSTVSIAQTGIISKVTVNIGRFYINSLTSGGVITLTHNGKTITLLDTSKCVNTQNTLTVADAGERYSGLKNTTCNGATTYWSPPTTDLLASFNGMDMAGDWVLSSDDHYGPRGSQGGTIGTFSVNVTYDVPAWSYGAWSTPANTCGSSTVTRTATCKLGTTTVADSQCTAPKDVTSKTVTDTSGCGYTWTPGTWTPVYEPNSRCGAKTETTTYTCTRSDGVTVADSSCTATKPGSSRAYADPIQCTYSWTTGQWSTANPTTCGTSTRTRTIGCFEDTNNGIYKDEALCLATSPRPVSSEVVSDYSQCGYGWYRTGYELSPCIAAKQTYRAYYSCKRADGTTADGFCGTNPPRWVVTQSCSYWRESWGTGNWFGGIYPGSNTGIGSYSAGGTTNGTGIVSGGADGQGGDAVGIGNSSAGSGGSGGSSGGVGTGGNTGPSKTGGTYDPINNIYVDQLGNRYQGGYYDSTAGAYYGGSLITAPAETGSVVMMRRPVPIAPR